MAIDWKDSSQSPSAQKSGSGPWFAVALGLLGLIAGYLLPSLLS